MPSADRVPRALRLTTLALVGSAFLLRLDLLRRHAFNPDEFQHLHGAWCIARGLLPYRDYFEHHTPWLHFFLAPFFTFFAVETDGASAEAFVFFARGWMWVFSGMALALTFWLGKLWDGEATACAGLVLLATSVMFLDKTLEIRPDVPAVVFLLASWIALLLALRREREGRPPHVLFAQGGLLLGMALLCTQKALFTLPASAVWLTWYLLGRAQGMARNMRLKAVSWHVAGVLATVGLVLGVFAVRNGLWAFVDSNLLVNLRWPVRFSPVPLLRQLFHENGLLVVLAAGGWLLAAVALARRMSEGIGRALVPLQAAGLVAGVFLIPVPYAQYLVLVLPLLALLAGSLLVRAVTAVSRLQSRPARMAGLAAIGAIVLAGSVVPMRIMAGMHRPAHRKVEEHLDRMRGVLAATRPDEAILDGFSGLGVFRPHADFHFFLHDEIRVLLGERGATRLFAALRDGVVAPDWVVADGDVLALPREIVTFLRENYEPVAPSPLWRRKDLWLDDGEWLDLGGGPTDALAGRGWYAPESDGDRTFRKGRGRRSSVRLPLRRPARCRQVVLHARPESEEATTVELTVNGRSLGTIRLSAGWHDYAVPLPRRLLRRGVNALQIAYDPVPSEADPVDRGRDALAAVDGIALDCGARPR